MTWGLAAVACSGAALSACGVSRPGAARCGKGESAGCFMHAEVSVQQIILERQDHRDSSRGRRLLLSRRFAWLRQALVAYGGEGTRGIVSCKPSAENRICGGASTNILTPLPGNERAASRGLQRRHPPVSGHGLHRVWRLALFCIDQSTFQRPLGAGGVGPGYQGHAMWWGCRMALQHCRTFPVGKATMHVCGFSSVIPYSPQPLSLAWPGLPPYIHSLGHAPPGDDDAGPVCDDAAGSGLEFSST